MGFQETDGKTSCLCKYSFLDDNRKLTPRRDVPTYPKVSRSDPRAYLPLKGDDRSVLLSARPPELTSEMIQGAQVPQPAEAWVAHSGFCGACCSGSDRAFQSLPVGRWCPLVSHSIHAVPDDALDVVRFWDWDFHRGPGPFQKAVACESDAGACEREAFRNAHGTAGPDAWLTQSSCPFQYLLSPETVEALRKPTFDVWLWEPNELKVTLSRKTQETDLTAGGFCELGKQLSGQGASIQGSSMLGSLGLCPPYRPSQEAGSPVLHLQTGCLLQNAPAGSKSLLEKGAVVRALCPETIVCKGKAQAAGHPR
ncbi:hypothetical protein P7K49_032555 [Saguinus oedipus]|uniref:Uncharacterized protein n=1 Tax=Saguinus oedipus TaxID=9490 RepID=A0ABQ9TZE1_SAGOE|nr:hypothetical protein P7K49_032555 [Saguinus oedipus]